MIIRWPESATLTAEILADEGWITYAYLWEQISGPATATIASPTSVTTLITFPETQGQYVFRFRVAGDNYPTDFTDYWLTDTSEQISTETGEPLIIDEAETSITADAIYRVFVLANVAPDASGPTVEGKDLYIKICGIDYVTGNLDPTKSVDADSLTITETNDSNPNTANFTVRGFVPGVGDEVIISLDSERIFAGQILRDSHSSEELLENDTCQVSVTDYSWYLARYRFSGIYLNVSATTIAHDIIAHCPGFTANDVQDNMAPVTVAYDEVTLANALSDLSSQVPTSIWKIDYFKNLHFGSAGYYGTTTEVPTPVTIEHPTLRNFSVERDLGQWLTRVRVNGPTTSVTRERKEDGILFVSSIKGFEGRPGLIKITDKDRAYETSYTGAHRRIKQPPARGEPGGLPLNPLCDPLEDQLRRTKVEITARLVRVPGIGLPKAAYVYYTTYVSREGESKWQDEITVTVTDTSIPSVIFGVPGGGGGSGVYNFNWNQRVPYNAIEFGCTKFPLFLSKINIYRAQTIPPVVVIGGEGYPGDEHTVTGEGGKLIGTIPGKSKFGILGTTDYIIIGQPLDFGVIKSPSSNTVVDSDPTPLPEDELNLPAEDIAVLPDCTDPETGEPTSEEGAEKPEYEEYLEGIPFNGVLSSEATVQRYVILDDTEAQERLQTMFCGVVDDGLIIDIISDTSLRDLDAMERAGYIKMAERNQVNYGVRYDCRDQKTHPGLYTYVDMDSPYNITDEFLIQTVTINNFLLVSDGGPMKSWPLYSVTKAAPKQTRLFNLLSRLR